MTPYDVVTKLIGAIEPVGESNEDKERLENLKSTIQLTDLLINEIGKVAHANKDRAEESMKKAGDVASEFYDNLGKV